MTHKQWFSIFGAFLLLAIFVDATVGQSGHYILYIPSVSEGSNHDHTPQAPGDDEDPSPHPSQVPTQSTTPTVTPTNTATRTPTGTLTPIATPTSTGTWTPTQTATTTPSATSTATVTPSTTPNSTPAIRVLPETSMYTSLFSTYLVGEVEETAGGSATLVRVTANFYNGNQLVGSEHSYTPLSVVTPHTKTCFRIISDDATFPDHTHYEFEVSQWSGREVSPGLVLQNVSTTVDEDQVEIIGLVHNGDIRASSFVEVVGTLYDSTGSPINCNSTFVNNTDLAPGQTSSFKITFFHTGQEMDSYRLQVQGRPSDEPVMPVRVRVMPETFTYSSLFSDNIVGQIEGLPGEASSSIKVTANFFNGEQLVETLSTFPPIDVLSTNMQTCFRILGSSTFPPYTRYEFEVSHLGPRNLSSGLALENVSSSVDGNRAQILGEVHNNGSERSEFVQVIATLFDTAGVPVACDYTYVNSTHLEAGQNSTFKIDFIPNGHLMETYRLQVQGRP